MPSLGTIMATVLAVSLAVNAGMGYALKLAWKDVATEQGNVRTVQGALAIERATLGAIEKSYNDALVQIASYGKTQAEIQDARDRAIAQLGKFRERMGRAAEGKPALVGRLASRATLRVMCDFHAASGGHDTKDCDAFRSSPPASDSPGAGNRLAGPDVRGDQAP